LLNEMIEYAIKKIRNRIIEFLGHTSREIYLNFIETANLLLFPPNGMKMPV